MVKQKHRKKRKFRNILVTILAILLLLGVLALVAIKLFVVEDVVVEGNELYDSKVIEQAILNDEYSWNTLYVFFKYRFFDTEDIPFVDELEVSIADPHTLHVVVYEKIMLGYLYVPEKSQYAYLDKDGFVVEISEHMIPGVPRLEGIDCPDVVLYEKLPIDKDDLWDMLALTQTLKRNNLVPDSIVYGQNGSPVLDYGNIQIALGSQEYLTQKVERIGKILPMIKDRTGILHLENWTDETSNIVFDSQ